MSAMIDDVLGLPDQLRDALWRIETAWLEPAESAGLMVCGMGGSAIGGSLAASALGDRLTRPLLSIRGYELPSWATPEWTVLCSSYSGNTEETLACFEAAEVLGARRIVVSTGGELVERAREAGGPAVIYGSDLTASVARRWKCQFDENAKLPAFNSELPEADHNEICGWSDGSGAMAAVFLEDCDQHPRERRRIELTAEVVAASGAPVVRIETAGETRVERLLWATLLGDLVSLEMASRRGVDPESIEA